MNHSHTISILRDEAGGAELLRAQLVSLAADAGNEDKTTIQLAAPLGAVLEAGLYDLVIQRATVRRDSRVLLKFRDDESPEHPAGRGFIASAYAAAVRAIERGADGQALVSFTVSAKELWETVDLEAEDDDLSDEEYFAKHRAALGRPVRPEHDPFR